jgi:hypothetical protein
VAFKYQGRTLALAFLCVCMYVILYLSVPLCVVCLSWACVPYIDSFNVFALAFSLFSGVRASVCHKFRVLFDTS